MNKNVNKRPTSPDMEITNPIWNNVVEGEPVTTLYSTSEETIVLPAQKFDGNVEFSFSPFHIQYVLGGDRNMVDLSEYDSIFDAIDDLKVDWTPESFYRPLPEENQDEKEG